jgi:excisionase family DNA binding protein
MSVEPRNHRRVKMSRSSGKSRLAPEDSVSSPTISAGKTRVQAAVSGAQVDDGLLTIREAATFLRVSESTIRNAIRAGRLHAYRFGAKGGSIRIAASDLQAYIASCATVPKRTQGRPSGASGGSFKMLDGGRLLAAWRQQGVLADPPNGCSAPSSESRCAP